MCSRRQQKHSGEVTHKCTKLQYLSKCLSLHATAGDHPRDLGCRADALCRNVALSVMDLLSVGLLVLRQTGSRLSQSSRPFRRNKVFRRERDAHKGSPPALHLTLSLTPENNTKTANWREFPGDLRVKAAPSERRRVPGDTMCCCDRTAASIICGSISRFSHRGDVVL